MYSWQWHTTKNQNIYSFTFAVQPNKKRCKILLMYERLQMRQKMHVYKFGKPWQMSSANPISVSKWKIFHLRHLWYKQTNNVFFWIFCRFDTRYGRTKYALTSLSCFYEMKSINKIVTTSINPEFESNVENVKIKLRKCMSKDTMSQMEQRDCYRRYHVEIDNLYIEYVTK